MGFRGVYQLATAQADDGKTWTSWLHKTSAPTPGAAQQWGDLSMGAGTPKYNAYVGAQLEATQLVNTNNSAIYLGPTPGSGETRHLTEIGLQTTQATQNVPLTMVLCDYLLFYPLIDGDSGDQQDMTQTAALPRYTDGVGVQAFLVCTSPMTTNGTVTVAYTDPDDAAQSATFGVRAVSNLGAIVHTGDASVVTALASSPFIPLQSSARGIKRIDSVTFPTAVGGFMSLVLVKPLASILLREAATWTERPRFMTAGGSLPRIYDGAFLNFIFQTSGTGNPATVRGALTFTWS